MGALSASVIVVGDEILAGYVQDTNSAFIAQRLCALGIPLDRVVTVPDDRAAIEEALRTELGRPRPRIVLTSGGVGGTPDDVTIEVVATTLGRELRAEPSLETRIAAALEWSGAQGIAIGAEQARMMRRMALIPRGATLLEVGREVTPGIVVDAGDGATVVVLPGVPRELRRIMTDGVEPALLAGRGVPPHVVELTHPYPESFLTPVFARIAAEFRDVALGSYPARECIVRLRGPRDQAEQAAELIAAEIRRLDADPGAANVRARWQRRWD